MYHGDKARKRSLVEFGFRLPSAYDNRPLAFDEMYQKMRQVVYVSATPDVFEVEEAHGQVVEQVIRPTGLLDPIIEVRKASHQVDDCLHEIHAEVKKGSRVLVTTLTKKLSEELTRYLKDLGIKAEYLHSDIDTLERVEILANLRRGVFDVLVGINLLREGLDLPEVSLVAILDADKEGFLRSTTSLIQTCGRAARNDQGRVIMYGDQITQSMKKTIETTENRRKVQQKYNEQHGIIPKTVRREIALLPMMEEDVLELAPPKKREQESGEVLSLAEIRKRLKEAESKMKRAAKDLQFEEAAQARDEMRFYEELELSFS
jgi:excinuclease ABC subunit B